MQFIRQILKNKIFSNMTWMMISSIAQMIISLFINSFTARYLGPSNFGVINYATSFVTIFTPLCQMGLYSIVIKAIVQDTKNRSSIIGSALFIRIVLGALSSAAIVTIIYILKQADVTYTTVAAFCSIKLVLDAFDIVKYWYQSQLQYKKVAFISIAAYIGMSVYRCILLINSSDIIWFGLSTTLDSFLIALGLIITYKADGSPKIIVRREQLFYLLSQSKNLLISAVVVGIGSQINTLLLDQFLDAAVVGYYTCAISCCSMFAFIPGALIDSLRPEIMKAKAVSEDSYNKRLSETISITVYLSLAFSIIIAVFAKPIVSILYGADYLPAVPVLRIIAVGFFLSYVGVVRTIWFVCENKLKYERTISVITAVLSIGLSTVLVYQFGLTGAVINYMFIQITAYLLIAFLNKNTKPFQAILLRGIRLKDINFKIRKN